MTGTLELPLGVRVRDGLRRTHLRFLHGARKPHNWKQLVRFLCVGASGYTVNLAAFAICVHVLKIDYRIASVVAFLFGCANNFWWNRHWTFEARHQHAGHQGLRFFLVSLLVFGLAYGILVALVSTTGMEKVLAQAIANIAATPLSFLAQKLWSFRA
jgi:putative flippase GtrA